MPATRRPRLTGRARSNANLVPGKGGRRPIQVRGKHHRPIYLLREVDEGRIDPHSLTPKQRRACLVVMANGSQTSAALAEFFGCAPGTIRKDILLIRAELGREVREWTMEQVVGDLAHAAEKYSAHALAQEDPGLAWTIKKDLAKLLKEWGVIGRGGGGTSTKITIEHVGESYNRMKDVLALALDPMLSGEIIPQPEPETIDVEGRVISPVEEGE